jgi:hypothetical protein
MGKRVSYLGSATLSGHLWMPLSFSCSPQAVFPVPEGILDYHGTKSAQLRPLARLALTSLAHSTIVLFVWAPDGHGTSIRSVSLEALKVLKGGVGRPQLANPGWSEREKAS